VKSEHTVHDMGGWWQSRCSCGWTSKTLPFPDPDAAYHVARLHDAVAHPDRIDWAAETEKFKRANGLT